MLFCLMILGINSSVISNTSQVLFKMLIVHKLILYLNPVFSSPVALIWEGASDTCTNFYKNIDV